jgi:hypothetical protein
MNSMKDELRHITEVEALWDPQVPISHWAFTLMACAEWLQSPLVQVDTENVTQMFQWNLESRQNLSYNTLLTNFIEQSLPWQAARRSVTLEFPNILWNQRVHYRVHKIPPLVPVSNEMNPIHTTPSYFSKLHFSLVSLIWTNKAKLMVSPCCLCVCLRIPPIFFVCYAARVISKESRWLVLSRTSCSIILPPMSRFS